MPWTGRGWVSVKLVADEFDPVRGNFELVQCRAVECVGGGGGGCGGRIARSWRRLYWSPPSAVEQPDRGLESRSISFRLSFPVTTIVMLIVIIISIYFYDYCYSYSYIPTAAKVIIIFIIINIMSSSRKLVSPEAGCNLARTKTRPFTIPNINSRVQRKSITRQEFITFYMQRFILYSYVVFRRGKTKPWPPMDISISNYTVHPRAQT